ncbi:guanylate kinase [Synergistales bacterium]|nr:guanylate kinase [Synergistales bacterium]
MSRGHLFVLSGPSGAGKGTLRKILFQQLGGLVYSISCTTREKRNEEIEGRDYFFVSYERFETMIKHGDFLEWANVHGNYYGTRRADVETSLELNCDIVLEIDVQGSRQIKAIMPEAVRIFITVDSLDSLEERLEDRGTETQEQLTRRLRNAAAEMKYARECEHIVLNDNLEIASEKLADIVKSYRNAG